MSDFPLNKHCQHLKGSGSISGSVRQLSDVCHRDGWLCAYTVLLFVIITIIGLNHRSRGSFTGICRASALSPFTGRSLLEHMDGYGG